jgi:hypothetical protein|tara:strand:+ start:361 stop:504 length:144 start_codon:yes stop_codon:yes gene_type:complete
MNLKKWRSIAVSVEIYEIIKQMADANDRSVSRQLAHIVKSVAEKEAA